MIKTMKTIKKALSLLSAVEKRKLAVVFIAGLIMAVLDLLGVASIMPFMAMVSNPKSVETNRFLRWGYETFDFTSTDRYLFGLGMLVFVLLVIANSFRAFATWLMLRFSSMQEYHLGRKLLLKYLREPYEFFLSRNSAELSKNILGEVAHVVKGFFLPAMRAFQHSLSAALIVFFLVMLDPVAAAFVAGILGGAYLVIYKFFKRTISKRGKERILANRQRYKSVSEAFGGIKDIKLMHTESICLEQFEKPSKRLAKTKIHNAVVGEIPNFALETLAFGTILIIVLYMLKGDNGQEGIIPMVALYAFAGRRLLPSFHQIFSAFTKIRFSLSTLDLLCREMHGIRNEDLLIAQTEVQNPQILAKNIRMEEIVFCYAGAQKPLFNSLTIDISANSTVAFVGPTGSGKTTAVDIILGLLQPQSGRLLVDDITITSENMANWQATLGYVPQHIYLTDDTIAANIAFGISSKSIDMQAVEKAAQTAHLHEFIASELQNGYNTLVGERGVRLSGGQRQRIGIARALYHNPSVLILDEATSALDNITERAVMEAIDMMAGKKTMIIIAHRLSTIVKCDTIFFMMNGKLQASGSYEFLLRENREFMEIAEK